MECGAHYVVVGLNLFPTPHRAASCPVSSKKWKIQAQVRPEVYSRVRYDAQDTESGYFH